MRKSISRGAALAAAVLVPLAFSGAGEAAPLKTGYYTIDHMAMAPDSVSSDTNYGIAWSTGLYNLAVAPACFNTAVNLPQGATIKQIAVWYSRKSTGPIYTGVLRHRLADGHRDAVGEKMLGGTNGQRKGVAVPVGASNLTVGNARFSYGFGICLNGENKDEFHTARITYLYLE